METTEMNFMIFTGMVVASTNLVLLIYALVHLKNLKDK